MFQTTLPIWPAEPDALKAARLPWAAVVTPLVKNVQIVDGDLPGRCMACGAYMVDRGDLPGGRSRVDSWRCPLCMKENEFQTVQRRCCIRNAAHPVEFNARQEGSPDTVHCALMLLVAQDLPLPAWRHLEQVFSTVFSDSEPLRFGMVMLGTESWTVLDRTRPGGLAFRRATYKHNLTDVLQFPTYMPVLHHPAVEVPAIIGRFVTFLMSSLVSPPGTGPSGQSVDSSEWFCQLVKSMRDNLEVHRILAVSPLPLAIPPSFRYTDDLANRLFAANALLDLCVVGNEPYRPSNNEGLGKLAVASGGECTYVNESDMESEIQRLLQEEAMIGGTLRLRTSPGFSALHRNGPGIRVHEQADDICRIQLHGCDRFVVMDLEFTRFEGFSSLEYVPAAQLALRYWRWSCGKSSTMRFRVQSLLRPSISRSGTSLRRGANHVALCSMLHHQLLDGIDRGMKLDEISDALSNWLVAFVSKSRGMTSKECSLKNVFKDHGSLTVLVDFVFRVKGAGLSQRSKTIFERSRMRREPARLVMRSIQPWQHSGPGLVMRTSPRDSSELVQDDVCLVDAGFELCVYMGVQNAASESILWGYLESNDRPWQAKVDVTSSWDEYVEMAERVLLQSSSWPGFGEFEGDILRRSLLAHSAG